MHTVLYVSHTHPTLLRGGLQVYADELFGALRNLEEFEAVFVAKVGPPHTRDLDRTGTRFSVVDGDPGVYFFHTQVEEFDPLLGTATRKALYVDDWRAFLEAQRPDVVHFHHSDWLGYDMVRETRRTLPDAAIIYTLHDFSPICHHDGKMVRRESDELCDHASPRRCHQCFPMIPAASFLLRERFVSSVLELVDRFIAPTRCVLEHYVRAGIPVEKIVHEACGRSAVSALTDPPEAGSRRRLAYFGQLARHKGVEVLLEAMKILQAEELDVELALHGANLGLQNKPFQQKIEDLLAETSASVRFTGQYEQRQLPALLAATDWVVMPSTWWEASPLVIQEALLYRRPVICAGIGGMAEMVTDGVNGLHFHPGAPARLADVIRRAVTSPELWRVLRDQIEDPRRMEDHLEVITSVYEDALDRRLAQAAAA